jgi:hypothetical protein
MINTITIRGRTTFEYISLIRHCFIDSTVRSYRCDRLSTVQQILPIYEPKDSDIVYTPKLIPSFVMIGCGDINGNVYNKIIPYGRFNSIGLYIKKVIISTASWNCVESACFVYNPTYQAFD